MIMFRQCFSCVGGWKVRQVNSQLLREDNASPQMLVETPMSTSFEAFVFMGFLLGRKRILKTVRFWNYVADSQYIVPDHTGWSQWTTLYSTTADDYFEWRERFVQSITLTEYVSECPPAEEDGMERFACPTPDRTGRYRCIDDHVLCDGFIDCPSGEDEDRQACMFYKTVNIYSTSHYSIIRRSMVLEVVF